MCLSFMNQKQESSIPQDLLTRLATVRSKGNMEQIAGVFKNITDREQGNINMITQIEGLLKQEKDQDDQLRQSNGNLQGRIPSEMSSKNYIDAVSKYRRDMNQASEANKKLENMFKDNQNNFKNLFLSHNELEEMFEQ